MSAITRPILAAALDRSARIRRAAAPAWLGAVLGWVSLYAAVLIPTIWIAAAGGHSPLILYHEGVLFAALWHAADRRAFVGMLAGTVLITFAALGFAGWPASYAIANALPPAIRAVGLTWVVRRFGGTRPFLTTGAGVVVFVTAALITAGLAAPLEVASDILTGSPMAPTWLVATLGVTIGTVVTAAPLLAGSLTSPYRPARGAGDWTVALGLSAAVGLLLVALPAGVRGQPERFLALVPLGWAAWRFGARGAGFALLPVALLVATMTTAGLPPFPEWTDSIFAEAVGGQLFALAASVGALAVAAVREERAAAAQEVELAEMSLRAVLEQSPEAIALRTADGRIGYANPPCLALWDARTVGDLADLAADAFEGVETHPASGAFERRAVSLRGTERLIRGNRTTLRGSDGTPVGTLVIAWPASPTGETAAEIHASRERLRELAAAIERARELERSRLSRELHDDLGQALVGIGLDVGWLKTRLRHDPTGLKRLASLERAVSYAGGVVRRVATELRPPLLDDLGLAEAVEWQSRATAERAGFGLDLAVNEEPFPIDSGRATAVFRILQEALTNVTRHARATLVRVELGYADAAVLLTVTDNGIGSRESGDGRGLGLLGMQERARAFGGRLTVDAEPGGGTRVSLRMPLNPNSTEPA